LLPLLRNQAAVCIALIWKHNKNLTCYIELLQKVNQILLVYVINMICFDRSLDILGLGSLSGTRCLKPRRSRQSKRREHIQSGPRCFMSLASNGRRHRPSASPVRGLPFHSMLKPTWISPTELGQPFSLRKAGSPRSPTHTLFLLPLAESRSYLCPLGCRVRYRYLQPGQA
jgi:hypothetical protein